MNPTESKKKYFTPESANQALVLIRRIVADIVNKHEEVNERTERIQRLRAARKSTRMSDAPYADELKSADDELATQVAELEVFVDELQSLGVVLKDVARGLVDFPAKMDGREVYLCWQHGEDEVSHWHELDGNFASRQSLFQPLLPDDRTDRWGGCS